MAVLAVAAAAAAVPVHAGTAAPGSAAASGAKSATVSQLRVGTLTESTFDRTRPTLRRVKGKLKKYPGRSIRIDVWYPAEGRDDGEDHPDAAPATTGPFPVVVFAPGYRVTPFTYRRTLHVWAQAGYVVVGVEFPGSGADGPPGQPTEDDLTQQPRDMSLALDRVTQDANSAGSWASGLLDLQHVAAAGHSDGASTVVRMVLSTAYRDDRIDTAVILAGGRLGGRYDRTDDVPVLLMNGDHDEYNEPSVFRDTWSLAHGRKAWVLAVGGHHLPPFAAPGLQESVIRQIEVAWLDHYLKGADTADAFYRLARRPGLTKLLGGGLPH